MRTVALFILAAGAALAARHVLPPQRDRGSRAVRQRPLVAAAAASFSTPSSLWPMAQNLSLPPNKTPCNWSAMMDNYYVPGCADGGYPCARFATLEDAQAACELDYDCGGVTSQDTGSAPWETRHGPKAVQSDQGEKSFLITNACHGDGGVCFALPPDFAIVANASSFSNDVLVDAMQRYTTIINTAYAPTTVVPPQAQLLHALTVTVAGDAELAFGADESYVLTIDPSGSAALAAPTVWGALRGLETMSQLARHTWTTNDAGAVNASFNEVCATTVVDAPRFGYRGLMIDTSRHFMPVSVIKQVMELMSYLKMNALRFHLIDETSWSYYVPELPIITNTSAFSPLHVYYPEDLSELVAFGRSRGIIVYPEVDFPSHSQGLLTSIPEMGCLSPGPNSYRMYIDPLNPDLWPTMDKIFAVINEVFPPSYPIHMGGDEVNRNAWATCPSVIAWANAHGVSNNIANAITDWWYTSMFNWLRSPPYNRVVFAWEDATDAVNASWLGASSGGLVLEQWNGNPGAWNSGVCGIAQSSNASVLVSGPFHDVIGTGPSYNSNPEQNYADMYNVTCPITPRLKEQIVGPELMFCKSQSLSAPRLCASAHQPPTRRSTPLFLQGMTPPTSPHPT